MAFPLSLVTPRVALYGAIIAALVGVTLWIRHDAASDALDEANTRALEQRIEAKERADAIDRQIRALSDCERLRDGIVRLSGDDDAAERAFQGCVQEAAEDPARDG